MKQGGVTIDGLQGNQSCMRSWKERKVDDDTDAIWNPYRVGRRSYRFSLSFEAQVKKGGSEILGGGVAFSIKTGASDLEATAA